MKHRRIRFMPEMDSVSLAPTGDHVGPMLRTALAAIFWIAFTAPAYQFACISYARAPVVSLTADVVLKMKGGQPAGSGSMNLEFRSLRIANVNTQASTEIQLFLEDLQHDMNSGAVKGRVTMRLPSNHLSTQGSHALLATVRLDFDGNRPTNLNRNRGAPQMRSGLKCNVFFDGTANSAVGFNLEGINPGQLMSVQLRLEDETRKVNDRRARSDKSRFRISPVSWEVPGVRFGRLGISIGNWGKTPNALRSLDKNLVTMSLSLAQYDAASETINGKIALTIAE